MKICKKCGKKFPFLVVINGEKKNLCSRKYCLDCSPYGRHNTKKIDKKKVDTSKIPCDECGTFNKKQKGRKKCWTCLNRLRRDKVSKKIFDIVGIDCWNCGYDKCKHAIDFHHIDAKNKSFQINRDGMMKNSWEKVLVEIKKCVRLCSNCHREYHNGLITEERIIEIYGKRQLKK